jgi:transposase
MHYVAQSADRIKVLVWDGTGLVLAYKRLETGKFAWPKVADGTMKLTPAQFSALFEGLDWRTVRCGPSGGRGRPWRDDRARVMAAA